jgi:hypothetical protein
VQVGGAPVEKIEKPQFGTSEALGILAAVLILLLAFGSVIAMLLPIATAVVAVAASFGLLDLLSHAVTVPSFAPELAALVGLGVGIDYALFVITRYRTALRAGSAPPAAVVTAMATSGRAVVFAGSTVVLSLLGLFLPRWCCWPCRSGLCGWPSPTRAPSRPPTPPGRPMTSSPGASARASTGRSWWPCRYRRWPIRTGLLP